jgi:hypothetical protein
VLDGERSHTIAFTEQCADHYTTNTIELAGVVGIEPTLSESKSDMLPLHNTPTKTTGCILFSPKEKFLTLLLAS